MRAVGAVRVVGARTGKYKFTRVGVGVERVAISTVLESWEPEPEYHRGSDFAAVFEVSGGLIWPGQPGAVLEVAASAVMHDGQPVAYYELDYTAIAIELRFAVSLGL